MPRLLFRRGVGADGARRCGRERLGRKPDLRGVPGDPAAESQRAAALLAQEFPGGPPSLVLIAETPTGTVDSRMAEESGRELTRRLSEMPGVGGVHSYWASSNPWLHAANGRTALVALPTDLTRWLCLSCRAWAAFRPRPGMQPAGEGATFTRLHRRGCSPIRSEAMWASGEVAWVVSDGAADIWARP